MGENCPYTIRRTPHILCSIIYLWKVVVINGKLTECGYTDFDRKSGNYSENEGDKMTSVVEQVLYVDQQSLPPAGFCQVCGGELYAPSLTCLRCERRKL